MAGGLNTRFHHAGRLAAGAMIALLVSGCASTRQKIDDNMITRDETRSIAEQPLKDFNLEHDEIPALLQKVMAAPYAPPKPFRCDVVKRQIAELRTVLGPDFDDPHDPDAGVTRGKAMDALRGEASSWIPFRNMVRWASGADRHAREMKRAILAGNVRRAYLKGVKQQLRCDVVTVDRKAKPPQRD